MKAYIQYLDISPVTGNIYAPCGDRSSIILDGRNSLETMIQDGNDNNGHRRPLYPHFRIMRGDHREAFSVFTTVPHEKLNIREGY